MFVCQLLISIRNSIYKLAFTVLWFHAAVMISALIYILTVSKSNCVRCQYAKRLI